MMILIISPFTSHTVSVWRKDQNFDLWLHPPTHIIPLSCLILLFFVMERVRCFIRVVKKVKLTLLLSLVSWVQQFNWYSFQNRIVTYPFLFLYTNVVEHVAMEMVDIQGHLPRLFCTFTKLLSMSQWLYISFNINFFSWLSFSLTF